MNTRAELRDFIDHKFFEHGAFITAYESQQVILGSGGKFERIKNPDELENVFYLKDFFEDEFLVYTPEKFLETSLEELQALVSEWEFPTLNISELRNEDSLYAKDFDILKQSFSEELRKVVLVSREEFKTTNAKDARKRFFAKAIGFGTGMPSGLWFKDYGIVGSTPEILFSHADSSIKTFALAGTMPKDKGEELLSSAKDRAEHNFVVSDILEKLKPLGTEAKVSETHLHYFKNIVHLKTDIEFTASDLAPWTLVRALSPTAALGGYPRKTAMQFLMESDYATRHPHRYFGSAFGIKTKSLDQALVMIRNIQWQNETFIIESGGGIVADSVLEKELEEIRLKRESIKGHYL